MNQIVKKILILSGGLFLFLFFFVKTTFAVDCNPYPPLSGTYTITTTPSCSFSGTPNGADNGGITVSTGVNLIIPANATVAWTSGQSITIQGTGSISINATGASLSKTNLWMVDADADGWPGTSTQTAAANSPGGTYARRYTLNAGSFNTSTGAWTLDCNDAAYSLTNSCCVPTTWYQDADGDGYGNPSVTTSSCTQPAGYVANNTDCNDSNINAWRLRHRDADGDGYGVSATTCVGNDAGYVDDATDCYDLNANAHPGQTAYFTTNRGDGSFDYNCDSIITVTPTTYYPFVYQNTPPCQVYSVYNADRLLSVSSSQCGTSIVNTNNHQVACSSNYGGQWADSNCTTLCSTYVTIAYNTPVTVSCN